MRQPSQQQQREEQQYLQLVVVLLRTALQVLLVLMVLVLFTGEPQQTYERSIMALQMETPGSVLNRK